jgi:hypothetical protein
MKLTDFPYDDLIILCYTLKKAMEEALKNVQFLQDNCAGSDLLPHYEKEYDQLQRLYIQAKEACIKVSMVEIIKLN